MSTRWIGFCCLGIVSVLLLSVASGIVTTREGQDRQLPLQGPYQLDKAKSMALVKNPNNFIEATIGGPQSLDPAIDYETAGGNVLQNVYETLLWYDGNTTTLKPWLATVIPTVANGGISLDGLNYTFTIRAGVKFHDNSTMNAGDVVFSIQRALKMHDLSGPVWMIQQVLDDYIAYYIGDTVGNYLAQSYNAPWIYNYLIVQTGGLNHVITQADVNAVATMAVSKVGTNQVKFHLTHAYPAFLAITAYTIMDVVSKNYTQANPDLNTTCMGTGPYELASWDPGVSIHLHAWSGYWGTKANIPDVNIFEIADVNTRLLMLQAGDADYISLPITSESAVNGNPLFFEDRSPTLDVSFFVFNYWMDSQTANSLFGGVGITDDFFQNIHMRLAFEYLFNASLFIQSAAHNNALPLNGVIPNGLQGYNASTPLYSYDLVNAATEMKMAANPNHPGQSWYQTGFTIPLFFNAGNTGRQTACMLLQGGLEALHAADPTHSGVIDATVNAVDWGSVYLPEMSSPHNFMPMYMVGWAPDYADPDDYAFPFLHTSGAYPIGSSYNNTTIDQLVTSAGTELNVAHRTMMYQDLMTKIHDNPPYIFVDQPNNFLVFRAWVMGEYSNPMYSDMYYAAMSKVNTPPVPHFQVTPSTGDTSTPFTFDASASSDSQDSSSALMVQWDWSGDGTWDTTPSTNKVATHTFTTAGDYNISVKVIDTGGLNATLNQTLVVSLAVPEFVGSMALVVGAAMALMITISRRGRKK